MANAADGGLAQTQKVGALSYSLGSYEKPVKDLLNTLKSNKFTSRLWARDAKLWTGEDEDKWLGWLLVVTEQIKNQAQFDKLSQTIKERKFTHAVLLGMGGSSLCVEVMRQVFGKHPEHPEMIVLDSVVPAQVEAARAQIDPAKTVFIVASKSGSTTEPNVLCQYFYDETKKVVGDKVGEHFIAITDPGSSMEKRAQDWKFAHIFHGVPSIGGRFSALSNFGMIPAAVMGINTAELLKHAESMVKACGADAAPEHNPGVMLGTIMGTLTEEGRDKVTIIASPAIHSLGTWLEQLIAESTGKDDRGIIPVASETLADPAVYGEDRLFVYVRLESEADREQDKKVEALEKAGNPVVKIALPDKLHLGAEFFRWEIATATGGAIIGINAFNQPNVQESKDFTKEYLKEYETKGALPTNTLLFEEGIFKLYADEANTKTFKEETAEPSAKGYLATHLAQLDPGDYFGINAYIECVPRLEEKLQKIRDLVMKKHQVATTVGFGPRFLHSTGQLHKGGPNTGVFLQITCDDKKDLAIPGEKFGFSVLKEAQSLGDFKALSSRRRRLLRVHLPADIDAALDKLYELVKEITA
ncbi:MAG: bifunctional transaldolase/phosoglucose isomerase [Candidatus Obscuribacterales bacterium]|jgi:transaldolase/glucose-6-phosphate isomerase|nr:bifunctional transaldolase/phosoglucose isomerase [Candidatus Obscuribacterales bacterium]